MTEGTTERPIHGLRMWPKDLGVALVLLVALALGWLLKTQVEQHVTQFQAPDSAISLAYPAHWGTADSLQDVLLKVEDPQTESLFKTTLVVESRELDPQNPPTLQDLVDRRVEQHDALTGYQFLSNADATVDGAKGTQLDYAYVVQPIDQPRRAALPVVVRAREYILVGKDRSYYLTLAAPESEFNQASQQFDRILQTVSVP